jgi:hypothetical protein
VNWRRPNYSIGANTNPGGERSLEGNILDCQSAGAGGQKPLGSAWTNATKRGRNMNVNKRNGTAHMMKRIKTMVHNAAQNFAGSSNRL